MTPIWLTRLNSVLTWLNPVLCLAAAVLAALVIAAAAARGPAPMAGPTVQLAQTVQRPIAPACARAVLPPELRDMLLHD
jgi:hypothetical protein